MSFDSKEDNVAETLNTKICSLIEFQSTKELQNINEGTPRDTLSLAFLFKTRGNVKKHRKNCECCPGHYLFTSVY